MISLWKKFCHSPYRLYILLGAGVTIAFVSFYFFLTAHYALSLIFLAPSSALMMLASLHTKYERIPHESLPEMISFHHNSLSNYLNTLRNIDIENGCMETWRRGLNRITPPFDEMQDKFIRSCELIHKKAPPNHSLPQVQEAYLDYLKRVIGGTTTYPARLNHLIDACNNKIQLNRH